jgi:hypothetical protein
MDFIKLFLRGVAFLPSVLQGIEALFGVKTGAQKKAAALEIVGAAINVADAVSSKQIADATKFTEGLGMIIDGIIACLNASIWSES